MTFAREKRTFGLSMLGASALAFALLAGCGDEDIFTSPPEPEGGAAGEPAEGGAPSSGGNAGSGGAAQAGTAGRPSEPPADAGAGGDAVEPIPEELGWSRSFGLPGINGATTSSVSAVLTTGVRKLWVGGEFSQAGDVAAKNVAIWNGQRWSAVGEGLPRRVERLAATPEENVYALVEAFDGEAPLLYWDGKKWSEVDVDVDDRIRAIDVDDDGTLYIAGYFKNSASWTRRASRHGRRPENGRRSRSPPRCSVTRPSTRSRCSATPYA